MAGIAHEEDSAPEWFAAQFPNIGEALPAALCEGLTANLLHLFKRDGIWIIRIMS